MTMQVPADHVELFLREGSRLNKFSELALSLEL